MKIYNKLPAKRLNDEKKQKNQIRLNLLLNMNNSMCVTIKNKTPFLISCGLMQ